MRKEAAGLPWLIGTCCCIGASSAAGPGVLYLSAFAQASPLLRSNTSSRSLQSGMAASGSFSDLAFGPKITVPSSHIFYQSVHSAAFVNLKPIVPGHVLVVPKRSVPRDNQLTEEESTDLWLSVRKVAAVIEKEHGASALNIAMQDGRHAGQSVPHVHFHILPRKGGDFENNDDIYDAIDNFAANPHSKPKLEVPPDSERKPRTSEDMAQEAAHLRTLF